MRHSVLLPVRPRRACSCARAGLPAASGLLSDVASCPCSSRTSSSIRSAGPIFMSRPPSCNRAPARIASTRRCEAVLNAVQAQRQIVLCPGLGHPEHVDATGRGILAAPAALRRAGPAAAAHRPAAASSGAMPSTSSTAGQLRAVLGLLAPTARPAPARDRERAGAASGSGCAPWPAAGSGCWSPAPGGHPAAALPASSAAHWRHCGSAHARAR